MSPTGANIELSLKLWAPAWPTLMRWVVGVLPAVADDLVDDEVDDAARELIEDDAALVLAVDVPAELCADTDRANRKLNDIWEKSRIVDALAARSTVKFMIKQIGEQEICDKTGRDGPIY